MDWDDYYDDDRDVSISDYMKMGYSDDPYSSSRDDGYGGYGFDSYDEDGSDDDDW